GAGTTLTLDLGRFTETSAAFAVAPVEGQFSFQPYSAPGDDFGALPSQNIGAGDAAGTGDITFAPISHGTATLRVETGAPSNLIHGFALGDQIQLVGVSATGGYESDANGVLTIPVGSTSSVTLNFADLAPQSLFDLSPMSGGGVDLTLR